MVFRRTNFKTLVTPVKPAQQNRKKFDVVRYMKNPAKQFPFTFGIKGYVEVPHQNYHYASIGDDFDLYYIGGRMLVLAKNWSLMNDFIHEYWGQNRLKD